MKQQRGFVILMIMILIVSSISGLAAKELVGDGISLALGRIDVSDVLSGMVPTYEQLGVNIPVGGFIEGEDARLQVMLGAVRNSYTLWTDADGEPLVSVPLDNDAQKFAVWRGDLFVRFDQRIQRDLDLYARYNLHWSQPTENIGGSTSTILTTTNTVAYPDAGGVLANIISFGVVYDNTIGSTVKSGLSADLSLSAAPSILLNDGILGKTDFYQVNLTVKGYLPIYTIPSASDASKELFGIYLADRFQVDLLKGSAIPQVFQYHPSLGTKMRGFESNSLGMGLTAVNNFEVRLYGPQLELIGMTVGYPRVQLFTDIGYGVGDYYNTAVAGDAFVASAGIEAGVDVFNFLDLGYRYSFVLAGENIAGSGSVGELVFFLHF